MWFKAAADEQSKGEEKQRIERRHLSAFSLCLPCLSRGKLKPRRCMLSSLCSQLTYQQTNIFGFTSSEYFFRVNRYVRNRQPLKVLAFVCYDILIQLGILSKLVDSREYVEQQTGQRSLGTKLADRCTNRSEKSAAAAAADARRETYSWDEISQRCRAAVNDEAPTAGSATSAAVRDTGKAGEEARRCSAQLQPG